MIWLSLLAASVTPMPKPGENAFNWLALAFELVADRDTMAPLPASLNAHQRLVDEAYSRGLIIYSRRTRGGLEGDHFMVCPPLTISDSEIGEVLDGLDASMQAFVSQCDLGPRAVA